jgi:RHS repeat-associated protein
LGLLYHIDGDDGNTSTPLTTTTYHYNAQGSTIALSNDSGVAIGRFHYDPYGLVVAKHGKTDTIFQFNGHYGIATDPTGLVHLNARFYNPFLKRFMNSDPAGFAGGMNWFAYSSGDPINQFDPLGLGPADSERYTWVDGIQDGIGTLGFIPGAGAIPDGVNGVIYLFRGKWGDALFSFGSAVPFAGDALAFGKYAGRINDVANVADEAGDVARAGKGGLSAPGARVTVGGQSATELGGRLNPQQMAALQAEHGTEFAQIYLTGAGRNGGGGSYYLLQGNAGTVNIPIGPNVRLINHTHPQVLNGNVVPLTASHADQAVMRALQRAGSPQRTSQVVPEVGPAFRFNATQTHGIGQ